MIHCDAVSSLREARPNAMCSSHVAFRVSAGRIGISTIMLSFFPSNDCTIVALCPWYAHSVHAACVASVAFEAVTKVRGHRGLKRRGWVVEMTVSFNAWMQGLAVH
jgi:hypothetical protein